MTDGQSGGHGFRTIDGVRCGQSMVRMRDGIHLNTFVYLPGPPDGTFPVILQRTPYGITQPGCEDPTDCTRGWLPAREEPLRGSLLRGWREITRRGYAAVYQDTRGRHGSEGDDQVYGTDLHDGHDTLEWISRQAWSSQRVGLSGSSAGATTALASAASRHPSVRAFFAQVGGSSIYDDVVYEGQSIELERLWLWVAKNIPGLSASHRVAAAERAGLSLEQLAEAAQRALARYTRLDEARGTWPPYRDSADWMHLPLLGYPDFALWQPYLDEILSHPRPDPFRAAHDFRRDIEVPGFHVTTWYDIFQTSVIKAFTEIQQRVGNQRLWVGPNDHYFIYDERFWPRDPYFEWFDHWLKDQTSALFDESPVFVSPRAWVEERSSYRADDWIQEAQWPPLETEVARLHLTGSGGLQQGVTHGPARTFHYDPRKPVPTQGGRNMLIDAGQVDQRPVQALPDYGLLYRGSPAGEDMTLAGPARVHLHVSSDCPDTDIVAKLIEVHPDGRELLLMDGVIRVMLRAPERGPRRLEPGDVVPVDIELGHICHTVPAGCALGIDITSSNFPRRARNTNSGHLLLAGDRDEDIRVAQNTVHHAKGTASWVELTVRTGAARPTSGR